jgi:hypothetical protein
VDEAYGLTRDTIEVAIYEAFSLCKVAPAIILSETERLYCIVSLERKSLCDTVQKCFIRLEQLHNVQSCLAQLPDFRVLATSKGAALTSTSTLLLALLLLKP